MYPLIRRYLRRVDLFMLLLCAACSVLSVVVLMSIGQTQLGSNNKASVQLLQNPSKIADAVSVAVTEASGVNLIYG